MKHTQRLVNKSLALFMSFLLFFSLLTPAVGAVGVESEEVETVEEIIVDSENELEKEDTEEDITDGDADEQEDLAEPSTPDAIEEETDENVVTRIEDQEELEEQEEQLKSANQSEEIKEKVEQAIKKTKNYYLQNPPDHSYKGQNTTTSSHSDFWVYSALWGAGFRDLKNDFKWTSEESWPWADHTYWTVGKQSYMPNEHGNGLSHKERPGAIIGALLLGKDPRNFGNEEYRRDLVEDLINLEKDTGGFSDGFGEPWAMIALELVDADYDKERHLQHVLSKQNKDTGSFGGADVAGWTLTALAPYMDDREDVKIAVGKAVNAIHETFKDRDEYPGMSGVNSNSTAAIVMGLAAVGEDLYSEKWIKEDGSLLDQLLAYQLEDGSFKWKTPDTKANLMATEQVLLALATVVNEESIFVQLKEYKQETQSTKTNVSIRVEGIKETLLFAEDFVVENFEREATALDATKQALSAAGIPFDESGGLISSIAGEEQSAFDTWDGWQYMVNDIHPYEDLSDNYPIKNGDEIVWFYGNESDLYMGWGDVDELDKLTLRSKVSIASQVYEGDEIEVKVTGEYRVWNEFFELVEDNVITDVEDADVHFDGVIYKTDENGIARIPGEKAKVGTYEIRVTKDIENSYPRLLRQAKKIIIEEKPEEEPSITVQLSVDGINSTILKNELVKVIEKQTALDALKQELDNAEITYGIVESSFGLYVQAINEEVAGHFNGWDGWMYTVNGEDPQIGADTYELKEDDKIRFYYSRWAAISSESVVESHAVNPTVTIKLIGDEFSQEATNVSSWEINTGTTNLEIDSIEKELAQEVKIKFTGEAKGGALSIQAMEAALEGESSSNELSVKVIRLVSNLDDEEVVIAADEQEIYIPKENEGEAVTNTVTLKFSNDQLPRIEAVRGSTTLEIPTGTKVESKDWNNELQIPRTLDTNENDVNIKINEQLTGQEVESVDLRIKVGGDKRIDFDQHVTLTLKGQKGKEAGFIDGDGKFEVIKKYDVSNLPNSIDDIDVYAYDSGDDLIIKTKHFTEFLAYKAKALSGSDRDEDGDGTQFPATVTLSVERSSIGKGDIISSTPVKLQKDDTAFDVLKRVASEKGISIDSSGSGASLYVKAIDGLAEFKHGPGSGWMYSVNGTIPDDSAGSYDLKAGDILRWQYTTDLGEDIGAGSSGGSGGGGGPIGGAPGQGSEVTHTVSDTEDQEISISDEEKELYIETKNGSKEVTNIVTLQFSKNALPKIEAVRGNTILEIPQGTEIKSEWNKKLQLPRNLDANENGLAEKVNAKLGNQKVSSVDYRIKVGGNESIQFNQHVTLTLKGHGEKHAGFIDSDGNFETIKKYTSTNTQEDDIYAFKSGNDLVIKTKHFTEFLAYQLIGEETTEKTTVMQPFIDDAAKWIQKNRDFATYDEFNDWDVLALARSGKEVANQYYETVEEHVKEQKGEFRLVTDYERIALAFTAIGKDARNIGGYDFIEKIYNNTRMTNQGTNGALFALLALDAKNLEVPANALWTREKLIGWILEQQNTDDGFPLSKAAQSASDLDMTAMALQALAKYKDQKEVKVAIDKAVTWISEQQLANGGFIVWNEENSESIAQVMIALTSLGIELTDQRFVKEKGDLLSALESFVNAAGGIAHVRGEKSNYMATHQGLMAFAANDRLLKGKNRFYDMTDIDAQKPGISFSDLTEKSFGYKEITHLVEAGVINGYRDGTFRPDDKLIRGQAAILFVNALQLDVPKLGKGFKDLTKTSTFYEAALATQAARIFAGKKNGNFGAGDILTREQMASVLVRAFNLKATNTKVELTDLDRVSHSHRKDVEILYQNGITVGRSNGTFDPKSSVSRAQFSVFLFRAME